MILKAGTYRFNDVLIIPTGLSSPSFQSIKFTSNEIEYYFLGFTFNDTNLIMAYQIDINNGIQVYSTLNSGWQGDYQEHTIDEQEVDDTFGTWYIATTNYNEVNAKPLAEITYNGETIAQLNAGETCTLKCAGLPMETDIIIKINEVN